MKHTFENQFEKINDWVVCLCSTANIVNITRKICHIVMILRTDNTMAKRKWTKGQTTIYVKIRIQLKIEQQEHL